MSKSIMLASLLGVVCAGSAFAEGKVVGDDVIAAQRAALAANGVGFGPQAPRDIDQIAGSNTRVFETAPSYTSMNLCNIHFHEGAEHRGGSFTTYLGNGDGKGTGTGFAYDGELSSAEMAPLAEPVGAGKYGSLQSGDTIETHFVHTSAQVTPGPTLGSCLSEAIMNPQLRVETIVMVLVNDADAADFGELASVVQENGVYQAAGLATRSLGAPVQYAGSTTGPSYNENGSPLQVSWSVPPQVLKVDINSVGTWLSDNIFDETAAHGVRNLVTNTDLLSPIN